MAQERYLGDAVAAILAEARADAACQGPRSVAQALASLTELTACRCIPAYANRGLLDPSCDHDYREDVDVLREAVGA